LTGELSVFIAAAFPSGSPTYKIERTT
jgi:hypothetical protein